MDIMSVDFMSLNAEDKKNIIYKIVEELDKATKEYTFMQKILAQTLFMSRCYHFLQRLLEKVSLPVPVLLKDIMEQLWQYLLGEYSMEELEAFNYATESVLVYLLVDDDEDLDKEAWEKYKAEWDSPLYFNNCLEETSEASYILDQIVKEEISWYELTDGELMGIVGNYIDDFDLENIYRKEDGLYNPDEYDRYWSEIYDSETFGKVFLMLIEDLKAAKEIEEFSKETIESVRIKYRDKSIFDEAQIEKIAGMLREKYEN